MDNHTVDVIQEEEYGHLGHDSQWWYTHHTFTQHIQQATNTIILHSLHQ